ncbi:DNA polymerase theta-like [Zerene cesonia]|uniref:DNA polymerase theta-like n=1 Tax=Zerene cesonia TaxID=33412 RepID=UPI0018E52221|nr:DNA polymerase theta-like [Zerene cesonia]
MNSLNEIKSYVAQELNFKVEKPISTKLNKSTKFNSLDCSTYNADILTQSQESKNDFKKYLKNWGLPTEIVTRYEQKGIQEMFQWQVDCLSNPRVLLNCSNLVYSAPTSAGKTLVAEILTIKTILERQKKVIIILPFVSIVREKMFYLQHILSSSGIRVEGFMGSQSPPGGLQSVHIAICTIEKANSLVNKLLDENSISELGAIIVDELHLLGDSHRGYILELLLTKVKYVTNKSDNVQIQIIGMSATLPNLEVLSSWLDAELYITDFRPIPLDEFCLIGNKYYDKQGKFISNIKRITENEDIDYVLNICLETIKEGCSILIFCMTKNRCESLAQSIASSFFKLGCGGNEVGTILREELKTDAIAEVLEQLKNCPVGLDQVLKNVVSFGVAYHHAGLTFDERDIIEGGFKSGAIRVLVATSTLSSGVNLPARKVIIRSPVFQRQPINILTYKQMIGRAGRMGKDTKGESILVCTQAEQKIGFDLMMGALDPVKSCIETEDKFMRAVIEMIASQAVCTKSELDLYSKCTLLFKQSMSSSQDSLLENTLKQLIDFELVRIQTNDTEERYVATSLGKACLSSSMAPNDGLSLFCELQKARQCIVLETDLHLIYLVTPYSVSSQWADLDWLHLLTLWESLTVAMKKVGELVGVQESFIIRCLRGANKSACKNKLNIHKRFYTALALQDLVNEVPLSEVAAKFQCARGFLQGLQQAAATFAGMVTAFCRQLGWKNLELLVSQFQDRLHFGVHSDLLDLMKLSSLNGVRARTLFDAGFETVSSIASADVNVIENALYKAVPFQSEKGREGDDLADVRKRNKIRNIWITGFCGMTEFTNKLSKILMRSTLKMRSMWVKKHYLYLIKLLGYFSQTFSDILVAEWLMDNKEDMSSVRELIKKYRNVDLLNTNITVDGNTKNYNELDKVEESCLKSWCLFDIADEQDKCFFDKYHFAMSIIEMENHVLKILACSEYQGIMVDKELASRLLVDVKSSQEILQKKAFKICGYHFNFNSSKDVAKVLGIYKGRKVSTKKSVLTAHNSPMASIVIYWRKLNSILTKTLYPLTEKAYMCSADNKINPSYTLFTCTGRISMHEPNLQNVPRTFSVPMKYLKVVDDFEPCDDAAEFNCRNIFKASPGYVFVSADYCQLEMRILTHYSKDAVLSRIMKSDVDVFKSIAASWGGVPESKVDDDLRQKAKQLCYGILYGMGNRTLSQHLDVSEMEAAMFMDSFYNTYPDVRKFTQNVVQECRSKGYVETLMKRRRYLPDINSLVVSKRNTAERQAVNTTVQGSAADIAKAAMCAIDNRTYGDIKPHLVLQMHDELIYEVVEYKKNDFINILKDVMETTVRLNVPLPVKVKSGYTWGDLEEIKL